MVFTETDTATTNQFGLATVQIGISASLAGVVWGNGNKYLQVGVDITGGTNFVSMGTSQLLSVPYALYSGNGGNGWGLSGNAGTTYGTNFIGTTDSVNLMFRVKDTVAGRIETYPLANTALGIAALKVNSGVYNSAFGASALAQNTTGSYNTAIGQAALVYNSTGINNTAVGVDALNENISGNSNTAVGHLALLKDTASNNTALGALALYSNVGGAENTAVGGAALFHDSTGGNNTAVGYSALFNTISGIKNTAAGMYSLFQNTSGTGNAALGFKALSQNTSGYSNVAIGIAALYSNTSFSNQVAIGDSALFSYIGTTSANQNTAVGSKGLLNTTTGDGNTAVGSEALYSNIIGFGNSAIGYGALYANTSSNNTANGYRALYNSTGTDNTAVGLDALYGNTTGHDNTVVGSGADVATGALINASAFGSGATVDSSNSVVIGNLSAVRIGGQVQWTTYSDERVKNSITENVPGLKFLKLLHPVTYHYDIKKENQLIAGKDKRNDWPGKYNIEKIAFSGFIAQQVDAAAKNIGYDFSGVDKNGNIWGLRYSEFVPSIVKSVQEVDNKVDEQQAIILMLQQQIDELKKQNEVLFKLIEQK